MCSSGTASGDHDSRLLVAGPAATNVVRVNSSASGTGLATLSADGTVLDTWFPAPALGPDAPDLAADLEPLAGTDADRGITTVVVRTAIESLADPPVDAHDVYLRLHLLSHRLVAPHGLNLDGHATSGGRGKSV